MLRWPSYLNVANFARYLLGIFFFYHECKSEFVFFKVSAPLLHLAKMNPEKLKKLQEKVRTGGKGGIVSLTVSLSCCGLIVLWLCLNCCRYLPSNAFRTWMMVQGNMCFLWGHWMFRVLLFLKLVRVADKSCGSINSSSPHLCISVMGFLVGLIAFNSSGWRLADLYFGAFLMGYYSKQV